MRERYTGTADSGGVHINSGIGNKAFFLAVAGGTHHLSGVTVTGIGTIERGANLVSSVCTVYMTSSTNFSAARTATLNAATDLFGTGKRSVQFRAHGLVCVAVSELVRAELRRRLRPRHRAVATELLVNGGFEGSVSPWVGSGSGCVLRQSGQLPARRNGLHLLRREQQRVGSVVPDSVDTVRCCRRTLTFWLNVTSSETTTTTQYDRLFVEVRNTAGTLLATLGDLQQSEQGNVRRLHAAFVQHGDMAWTDRSAAVPSD